MNRHKESSTNYRKNLKNNQDKNQYKNQDKNQQKDQCRNQYKDQCKNLSRNQQSKYKSVYKLPLFFDRYILSNHENPHLNYCQIEVL